MDCLASTGANVAVVGIVGVVLIAVGMGAVLMVRRQRAGGSLPVVALAVVLTAAMVVTWSAPVSQAATCPSGSSASTMSARPASAPAPAPAPAPSPAPSPTPTPTPEPVEPDLTPSISGPAELSWISPTGTAAPVELTLDLAELAGSPTTGPVEVTVAWPAWLAGPATVTGAGWSLTSQTAASAVLTYAPTVDASATSSTATLSLTEPPNTRGPSSGTVTATITAGSGGDSDPANNTASAPIAVLIPPDVTPTMSLPDGVFTAAGQDKTVVITVSEVNGTTTDAGRLAVRVLLNANAPFQPYNATLTTATPAGGTPVAVSNSSFVATPGPVFWTYTLAPGVSIPANGSLSFAITVRSVGTGGWSSSLNSLIVADPTWNYDSNPVNNSASVAMSLVPPLPDLTPTVTGPASLTWIGPAGPAAPVAFTVGLNEVNGAASTSPVETTVTWPTWLAGPATISGAGWSITSQTATSAVLSYAPTVAAGGAATAATLSLTELLSTRGPLSGTVTTTITAGTGGDSVATNNTASTPTSVLTPPDTVATISLPDGVFTATGQDKTVVITVSEINGTATDTGRLAVRFLRNANAPPQPYDTTLTTATPAGGGPVTVSNSSFVATPGPVFWTYTLAPGVSIPANGSLSFAVTVRSVGTASWTSSLSAVIIADNTWRFDSDPNNNSASVAVSMVLAAAPAATMTPLPAEAAAPLATAETSEPVPLDVAPGDTADAPVVPEPAPATGPADTVGEAPAAPAPPPGSTTATTDLGREPDTLDAPQDSSGVPAVAGAP